MPNDGVFYTVKLNIKRIQEEEDFIDDSFNAVIDDIDNKVVGISHLTSGAHWNIWEANTAYAVGDVIRWPAMKSHQYAKCIQAGNTDSVRPTVNVTGSEVTNGTTKWKIVSLTSTSDVNGGAIQIWQGGGSLYERGDAVLYASSLYRCKVASHKSSNNFEDDKDNWQEVYASVRPWEDNKFYYENDVVIVGLFLYKCSEDHTSANDFDLPVEKGKWRMVGDVSKVREWEVDTYYMENQLVTIGGILYRSLYTHISDSDSVNNDADFWEPLFASISSWMSNYYYSAGSVVLANNILYRCIEPHVSSSIFSSDYDKWELLHVLPANVYDWDIDTTYTVNQVVKYDGNLYRVISNHISAVDFDPTKFELLTDSINDWISSMDYKVGQYVNYNGSLYKCILDNNDDDFNPANWQKVSGSIDQWESDFDYSVGDIVINANKLYQCNTAHTSSSTFTPDADKWTEISACITRIPNWEASTDYVVGDLVAHDAKIYRCVTAHTSGNAWNSTEESKWEELSPTVNEISNWAVSTDYEVGQLVIYDNKLYRCNTAHTSDSTSFSTNISYWDLIGSSGIDVWESNKAYTTSSVVIYNNKIYKCNTAHTSTSTFDDTKWEEISKTKFNDWSANTSYVLGDYVVYNNKIYKCTSAHTSGDTFNDASWVEISSADIPLWAASTLYAIGNIVIYNNNLYRCKTAHTSTSEFDETKWDVLSIKFLVNEYSDYGYLREDEVLTYEDVLFRANKNFTSSEDISQENSNLDFIYANIAPWKTGTYYRQGSLVINNGGIYQCNTSHTSGANNNYKNLYIGNGMIKYAYNETVSEHIFDLGDTYHIKWMAGIKAFSGASIDEFSAYVGDGYSWQLIGTCDTARDTHGNTIQFYPDTTKSGRYLKLTLDSYHQDGTDPGFVAEFTNFRIDADLSYYWTPLSGYPEYIYGAEYKRHDMVTHGTKIYKCIVDRASSTFVTSEWEEIGDSEGESIHVWDSGTRYTVGNIVLYNNRLYRCTTAHVSTSSFDVLDWVEISSADIPLWSHSVDYYIGNDVIYDNNLYRCNTAHTSTSGGFYRDIANWDIIGTKMLASDWLAFTHYNDDEIVFHDNVPYRVNTDYESSYTIDYDDSKLDFVYANIRPWASNTYYRAGSVVIGPDKELYRCTESHTSSSSNSMTNIVDVKIPKMFEFSKNTIYPRVVNDTYSLDLGGEYDLVSFFGIEAGGDACITRILVSGSSNNVDFTEIGSYNNPNARIGTHVTIPLSGSSRYLNFVAVGRPYHSDTDFYSVTLDNCIVRTRRNYWERLSTSAYFNYWESGKEYIVGDVVVVSDHYGVSDWVSLTSYVVGDYVVYDNYVFCCIEDNSDETFTSTKWDRVSSIVANIYKCILSNSDNVFNPENWQELSPCTGVPVWVRGNSYIKNTVVLYNNHLYEVTNDINVASASPGNSSDYSLLSSTVVDTYSGGKYYAQNELVIYNGGLYIANQNIELSSESFNFNLWSSISCSLATNAQIEELFGL